MGLGVESSELGSSKLNIWSFEGNSGQRPWRIEGGPRAPTKDKLPENSRGEVFFEGNGEIRLHPYLQVTGDGRAVLGSKLIATAKGPRQAREDDMGSKSKMQRRCRDKQDKQDSRKGKARNLRPEDRLGKQDGIESLENNQDNQEKTQMGTRAKRQAWPAYIRERRSGYGEHRSHQSHRDGSGLLHLKLKTKEANLFSLLK
jgi:hypothetical protein